MSEHAILDDHTPLPEPLAEPSTPAYILDAAAAAGEWWAKSDRDPRIKFQPVVILKLLQAIREGMHYEPACALAGVSYRQFGNWQNIAEDNGPESPHGIVAAALKLAEAEAEGETVRYVRAASRDPRFWAAGMTFLERRHPDRWRRPSEATQVQVHVGVALGLEATEDQRRAMVPQVVIQQIVSNNAMSPALGTDTAIDATFASDASLSPPTCNTYPVDK